MAVMSSLRVPESENGIEDSTGAHESRNSMKEWLPISNESDDEKMNQSAMIDADRQQQPLSMKTDDIAFDPNAYETHIDTEEERNKVAAAAKDALENLQSLPHFIRSLMRDAALRKEAMKCMHEIRRLAVPVVVAYLLQMTLNMVALAFVGHLNASEPQILGAAALGNTIYNVLGCSWTFGLASALDTLLANAYGAKDYRLYGAITCKGFILLTFLSIPVFIIFIFANPILLSVRQDPVVSALTAKYLLCLMPGLPAVLLYEVVKKFLQTQSILSPLITVGIVGNIFNIVACAILTNAFGLNGAGIAVTLSEWFMLFSMCGLIYARDYHSKFHPHFIKWQHLFHGWGGILKLGIPGAAMQMAEWCAFESMTLVTGTISTIELDSFVVILQFMGSTYSIGLGIGIALSVLVGNLLGEGKPALARMIAMSGVTAMICIDLLLIVIVGIFRSKLGVLFSDDPVVVARVGQFALLLLVIMPCDHMQGCAGGVIRGCGKQGLGAVANLVAYYVLALPLGLFLAFVAHWCGLGVLVGLAVGAFTTSAVFLVVFARMSWDDESQKALDRVVAAREQYDNHSLIFPNSADALELANFSVDDDEATVFSHANNVNHSDDLALLYDSSSADDSEQHVLMASHVS